MGCRAWLQSCRGGNVVSSWQSIGSGGNKWHQMSSKQHRGYSSHVVDPASYQYFSVGNPAPHAVSKEWQIFVPCSGPVLLSVFHCGQLHRTCCIKRVSVYLFCKAVHDQV